jgi:hypothetical protein
MHTEPAAQPVLGLACSTVAAGQKPVLVANAAIGRTGVPLGPHELEVTVHADSAAP